MANHNLSLEIPQVLNSCIIKLFDTSVYNELVPLSCPYLHITVPGFTYSVQLDFEPNSSIVLTACMLNLQTEDCDEVLTDLPDGIYVIRYSVSPNEYVYVEYNHLKISKALQLYRKLLCSLDLSNCEPSKETQDSLNKLLSIKAKLDAAVAKVEDCHNPKEGMVLYDHALSLLKKFKCKTCK
jgi:hypothetical protein